MVGSEGVKSVTVITQSSRVPGALGVRACKLTNSILISLQGAVKIPITYLARNEIQYTAAIGQIRCGELMEGNNLHPARGNITKIWPKWNPVAVA